ncbi:MAG: metal ABC transporter permease [Deltaproteobacteria bacterium]|nr:metal ABC transporter permease [Deltaproteobacteria bacterium]
MNNEFLFLLPAFVACLVLTGIHTYLGIHVIARGVIFVDIALAQIAALGMTVALLLGFSLESQTAYFFGLGFTLAGACFFAFFRDDRLPEEALIGVSFAASSALAVLIADRIPHGSEHLKFILNGNILWVGWGQILKTAVIYSVLGFFHYRFRHPFLLVSNNPAEARKQGLKLWLWDLFFYSSFGLVITSSVQMAGILLVFSLLIVPALIALLFTDRLKTRLVVGWILGTVISGGGIAASYAWDLPTGAAIVAAFGITLAGAVVIRKAN